MIKISTLSNIPSTDKAGLKGSRQAEPGCQSVKLLISYSQALQVMRCRNFSTCYVVLN